MRRTRPMFPPTALKLFQAFLFFTIFTAPFAAALDRHPETPKVLISAEGLFQTMKDRDYRSVWKHLSSKSKDLIVRDVHRECRKSDADCTPEKVAQDFDAGGPLSRAYWDSYLFHFDPDMVLEKSTWTIAAIKARTAELNILYEKSQEPAVLKMFKEDGFWKVGLEETFRPRRMLPK